MKSAYNETWLHNLHVVKEAKEWKKQGIISAQQFATIQSEYQSGFYHPNVIIRILLFVASLIALAGITGMLGLLVKGVDVDDEKIISILCLLYGIGSFFILDKIFITTNNHYKSGVTEALLYHSAGFMVIGFIGITDFNEHLSPILCLFVFSFAAFRYIDLIATLFALGAFAWIVFYELYEAGEMVRQFIPFACIILFTPLYFYFKGLKRKIETDLWLNCLILVESLCLLVIYAAGNYLVVRELSEEIMSVYLAEGEDIPFAFLFYFLTIIVPIVYLYFGIKNKDIILLRVSLITLACCVFTFKYYYSTGHPEITLTAAGAILLLITLALFRYLKTPKHGFTRENILSEKWANANAGAFIVSQTLGGNQSANNDSFEMGGGGAGGGGSGGGF